jgi:sugar phosphate permease
MLGSSVIPLRMPRPALAPAVGTAANVSPLVAHARSRARASASASLAAPNGGEPNDSARFRRTRLRVFISIIVGYACYYLTRNSLTYVAPAMSLDMTSVGLITSLFPLCYGCSKFVAGVLGDRLDPRTLLAGGLLVTSLANLAFGASSTMSAFCLLWCINGLVQGCGAPSCAKILTAWFAGKERGTYWGLWNLSHNLGGFTAPLLAGTAAKSFGWRAGFAAPGLVGVCVSALVYVFCRSTPEGARARRARLNMRCSCARRRSDLPTRARATASCCLPAPCRVPAAVGRAPCADSGFAPVEEPLAPAADAARKPPLLASLKLVVRDPRIWLLALTYLCVYVVRQGVTSWMVFYLLDTGRAANAGAAALRVTGLELGGLAGSLLAGKLSDVLVARAPSGRVGRRIRVVCAYLVALAFSLALFARVPAQAAALQWLSIFLIGASIYGPQMLVGLCGAELVGRGSVGASEGLLGLIAYSGAAMAGFPLAALIKVSARASVRRVRCIPDSRARAPPPPHIPAQSYGWPAFFQVLTVCSLLPLVLLAGLVNAKAHSEDAVEPGKKAV